MTPGANRESATPRFLVPCSLAVDVGLLLHPGGCSQPDAILVAGVRQASKQELQFMFDRLRQLVRAHPVVAFYALAFPLSWRAYAVDYPSHTRCSIFSLSEAS